MGLFGKSNKNQPDQSIDPDISELLGIQPQPAAPVPPPSTRPAAPVNRPPSPPSPSMPAQAKPSNAASADFFIPSSGHTGGPDDLSDFLEGDAFEQEPEPEPEPRPAAPEPRQPSPAEQAARLPEPEPDEPESQPVNEDEYRIKGLSATHKYVKVFDFEPKGFIRRAVDGENPENIRIVAKMKKLFDNPADKKDKFLYRQKLTSAYWNLMSEVVGKVTHKLPIEKILLIRYGLLDASYLRPEQISMIKSIPLKKETSEPIFYMDEWLRQIAAGKIKPSLVDETAKAVARTSNKEMDKMQRKVGARDAELSNLRNKLESMNMLEDSLKGTVNMLTEREIHPVYDDVKFGYTKQQLDMMNEIMHTCRKLSNTNREVETQFRVLSRLEDEIDQLRSQVPEGEAIIEVNSSSIVDEFNSLRQMLKMCVGRQGNHFPILYAPYFGSDPNQICTRENIIDEIKLIEKFDPGLFVRRYKQEEHRIYPYIVILPGYGESGICWEPFDKFNKATSRGRIAVSMFTKSIRRSLLSALADLRWQVAKETAQHYWMEEGLTGKYYQYYETSGLKGDIKTHFINDYILWITMESQGMQKLERDSRPVFWRNTPFPQPLKDILKNRGFFYKDLYTRDENRARSDGY